MNPLERELARQRRALLATENVEAKNMVDTYAKVMTRMKREYAGLSEKIQAEYDAGRNPTVSWLHKQDRFSQLLTQMEREAWSFGRQASEMAANGQRATLDEVNTNSWTLVERMMGSSPAAAMAKLENSWIALPSEALKRYVGFASDGGPLASLFAKIAPDAAATVSDAISYGITTGQHPRVIASAFQKAASVPLNRALTITRTEVLRAYRSAAIDSYKENPGIVETWIWNAELSTRTCSACWAMHGTEHSMDEALDGHPRCRCAAVPKARSWSEMGYGDIPDSRLQIRSGQVSFDKLAAHDQYKILGKSKYDAYRSGEISFNNLVARPESPTWGTMRREASLSEARSAAAA